ASKSRVVIRLTNNAERFPLKGIGSLAGRAGKRSPPGQAQQMMHLLSLQAASRQQRRSIDVHDH
ncbi:MAG: hypothetical protein ACU83P_09605, partial [Gammaproteobacteria bacterium]